MESRLVLTRLCVLLAVFCSAIACTGGTNSRLARVCNGLIQAAANGDAFGAALTTATAGACPAQPSGRSARHASHQEKEANNAADVIDRLRSFVHSEHDNADRSQRRNAVFEELVSHVAGRRRHGGRRRRSRLQRLLQRLRALVRIRCLQAGGSGSTVHIPVGSLQVLRVSSLAVRILQTCAPFSNPDGFCVTCPGGSSAPLPTSVSTGPTSSPTTSTSTSPTAATTMSPIVIVASTTSTKRSADTHHSDIDELEALIGKLHSDTDSDTESEKDKHHQSRAEDDDEEENAGRDEDDEDEEDSEDQDSNSDLWNRVESKLHARRLDSQKRSSVEQLYKLLDSHSQWGRDKVHKRRNADKEYHANE